MATEQRTADVGQMVSITDAAREKVGEILDNEGIRGRGAIRIAIQGRGANGFEYSMALEEEATPDPGDVVQDEGDFKVIVDADTAKRLTGATVDFVGQLMGGGFKIDNPNPAWDDPLAQSVQRLIDAEINPGVASHGGHVELLDVKEKKVYVRLGGGCQGCGMVDVTLRQGIEALLKRELPEIEGVVDTTDHAGGSNPYFQGSKGGESPIAESGAAPYYQPAKGGGGGGCGAPGCGPSGCGAGAEGPHHQPAKGGPQFTPAKG